MGINSRTNDIYEKIKGYPLPPQVPLPSETDIFSYLAGLGLKPGLSQRLVKCVLWAIGFRSFHKDLPNQIERILRTVDFRRSGVCPPTVSATLAIEDDSHVKSPSMRAATLIAAASAFYDDLLSAQIPADSYKNETFEMGQYANLFGNCLVWNAEACASYKTAKRTQILVIVAQRFYLVNLGEVSKGIHVSDIARALDLMIDSESGAVEQTPAILSAASYAIQREIFAELKKDTVNRESLELLQDSLFTVCIDERSHPSTYDEAAKLAHSCNFQNRWFHASLQFVVFGNAKASAICDFSATIDGNVMMRALSEIQKRALTYFFKKEEVIPYPLMVTRLKWKVQQGQLQRAFDDLQSIQDHQIAIFEWADIGEKLFPSDQLKLRSVFVLALQQTVRQLIKKDVKIKQLVSMSKYRCMGLGEASMTTPEAINLLNFLDRNTNDPAVSCDLLRKAIDSQNREIRQARKWLPIHIIFILFLSTRAWKVSKIFALMIFKILWKVFKVEDPFSIDVIISHPDNYPNIPVVGRPGVRLPYVNYFGLHYQITDRRTIVTVMPSLHWDIPNKILIHNLHENFVRLIHVFETGH